MKLITSNLKTHIAEQFRESFSEEANTIYYMTAHRSVPFSDDNNPPTPMNGVSSSHYELYDEVIFGKHISEDDVALMAKNNTWVSGTVYSQYDDQDDDLAIKDFYVVSPEGGNYHIFKCLSNNDGAQSTDQPLYSETDPTDTLYITSDGYQWKYLSTVTNFQYSKFSTASYVPVFEDVNVTNNAVDGAIDTILVTSVGESYNSYAECSVKESAVAGNNLLYSLSGERSTDYLLELDDVTDFVEERVDSINTSSKNVTGVITAVFPANNTIQVTNTIGGFDPVTTITGQQSSANANIITVDRLTTSLSANTDFYKGSSVYIRYGTGAGQLKTITEYIVTGDERRILINTPFSPVPDNTSVLEIGPRIIISGDGDGANAVATIDPSTNSIAEVEMINRGVNYSFADITILGNTGFLDESSSPIVVSGADARAVISPPGGHGANVASELYCSHVGIVSEFSNTEFGTIPTANDYRKFSILKEPLFANVELTLESSSVATGFDAGETITQDGTGATGLISNRDGQDLRLTNVRGFFETGNTSFQTITGENSGYTAGVDSIDRLVETFDQREIYQVEILDNGPLGNGFNEDELVVQPGLETISSDLLKITIQENAYVYVVGEIISQVSSGANATIVDRSPNTITVSNISGDFELGNILGDISNITSTVINIDNTIMANAIGFIHEIINSNTIGLTNVKGNFSISDDVSGTVEVFNGQDTEAVAKITGRDFTKNHLVDNSGEFLYVESMLPIERADDQSEKIKIVIEF